MNPNQALFNAAYLGLKAQGFEKSKDDINCLYRGPNGLKCAIGHCIPDERYDREMDNPDNDTSLGYNPPVQAVLDDLYPGYDLNFACRMQRIHDDTPGVIMQTCLESLAREYDLEVPA